MTTSDPTVLEKILKDVFTLSYSSPILPQWTTMGANYLDLLANYLFMAIIAFLFLRKGFKDFSFPVRIKITY
jgi:hypothetical protein